MTGQGSSAINRSESARQAVVGRTQICEAPPEIFELLGLSGWMEIWVHHPGEPTKCGTDRAFVRRGSKSKQPEIMMTSIAVNAFVAGAPSP